jgi:aspartyl-tRNA(Asn)/glutamyl-tRNA(Gln) amidotransferase subunit B
LSGIDLNRAGTPLLEIVSEPDMRSAKEAVAYMKTLHELVRYLGICDGNMQEGSFRCDANVSVRPKGQKEFGTRTELKNINSFKFVEKAINYEIERQIDLIESGGKVVQETRLYDSVKDSTRSMRSKEEANDYRYFPDPDLLPVFISEEFKTQVRADLPELPWVKRQRFSEQYRLDEESTNILTSSREMADYFEALLQSGLEIVGSPVDYRRLAGLLARIADNTISGKIAKQVFDEMWQTGAGADEIIAAKGLRQISDSGVIASIIDQIIADNPAQVEQYRSGKDKVFGFFVGQVMKAMQGKANPEEVNKMLKDKLSP